MTSYRRYKPQLHKRRSSAQVFPWQFFSIDRIFNFQKSISQNVSLTYRKRSYDVLRRYMNLLLMFDTGCMATRKELVSFDFETFDVPDIFIAFISKARKWTTELESNKKFQKSIISPKISVL